MTTTPTTVPFSKLVARDDINARPIVKDGLDELAASIEAKGVVVPLIVRPCADDPSQYEIMAGRRRYLAVQRLIKATKGQGTWSRSAAIPVVVRGDDDTEALETSLLENTMRLDMHPADKCERVADLMAKGKTEIEIARALGMANAKDVRRYRALGAIAPVVRDAWRRDKIDEATAKAFTIHPNHAVQAAAFERLKKTHRGQYSAHTVRHELAGNRPSAKQVPAQLLERYLAAGGTTAEDLFSDDALIDDGALLAKCRDDWNREQTAGIVAVLKGHGWGWVEIASAMPHGWHSWDGLDDREGAATPEQQARIDALERKSHEARRDDNDEEADRLVAEINLLEAEAVAQAYTAEEKAGAGVVIQCWGPEDFTFNFGIVRPDASAASPDGIPSSSAATEDEDSFDGPSDAHSHPGRASATARGPSPLEGEVGAIAPGGGDDDTEPASDADPFASIPGTLSTTVHEALTVATWHALTSDPYFTRRVLLAALACAYDKPLKLSSHGHPAAKVNGYSLDQADNFRTMLTRALAMDAGDVDMSLACRAADSLDMVPAGGSFGRADNKPENIYALRDVLPAGAYLAAAREAFLPADYFKRARKAVAHAALDEMREAGCTPGLAPDDVVADMKAGELAIVAADFASRCGWLPPELRHPAYALTEPIQIAVPA